MVGNEGKRYGVDLAGDRIRIVGRSDSTDQVFVDQFIDIDPSQFKKGMIEEAADLYFAVSERDAVIKRVKIPQVGNLDPDRIVQFELLSSLLDGADKYYFESYGVNGTSDSIAVAYNRALVDRKVCYLQEKIIKPSGFRLRSLAMAAGFLHFCPKEEGKLVCLVDVSNGQASYCFLKDNQPIQIGAVADSTALSDRNNDVSRAFVLDLAATIQYQMAIIKSTSHTAPLSLILITGYSATPELATRLEENIGVKTAPPCLGKTLLADNALPEAEKYLVILGLTVDF